MRTSPGCECHCERRGAEVLCTTANCGRQSANRRVATYSLNSPARNPRPTIAFQAGIVRWLGWFVLRGYLSPTGIHFGGGAPSGFDVRSRSGDPRASNELRKVDAQATALRFSGSSRFSAIRSFRLASKSRAHRRAKLGLSAAPKRKAPSANSSSPLSPPCSCSPAEMTSHTFSLSRFSSAAPMRTASRSPSSPPQ